MLIHIFNPRQKTLFAEKFMDLANLALGGLVLGQALTEKINWNGLLIGSAFYIIFFIVAYFLEKGD